MKKLLFTDKVTEETGEIPAIIDITKTTQIKLFHNFIQNHITWE